ncbi:MAG: hypothetical protein MK078_07735 [Crocinitomicaceae bacterium]|nr:hypothetical protein [Crocinitomicaceae bacterium]
MRQLLLSLVIILSSFSWAQLHELEHLISNVSTNFRSDLKEDIGIAQTHCLSND